MPRRRQPDAPGTVHHVTNRGIARRPLYETRAEIRYFLAQVARAVRAGLLEVLAFCVLTTHFHLLVRSLVGGLSRAMLRVEYPFARSFNRTRRRDGPVFRGRFRSSIVDNDRYLFAVIRYIDANPVEAGLVERPEEYPFGSAYFYHRPSGPPWLARRLVEAIVREAQGIREYDPRAYGQVFSGVQSAGARSWVEGRLEKPAPTPAGFDDLFRLATPEVRDRMIRNAMLADGIQPGAPLLASATVRDRILAERQRSPPRILKVGRQRQSFWDLLEAGLLRGACALTIREIAEHQRVSHTTALARARQHEHALRTNEDYALEAAEILQTLLRASFPLP